MVPPAAVDTPVVLSDDMYSAKVAEFKFVFPEEGPSPPASPPALLQVVTPTHDALDSLAVKKEAEQGPVSSKRGSPESSEGSAEGKRRRYCLVRLDDKTGKPQRPATEEEITELQRTVTALLLRQQEEEEEREAREYKVALASGTHSLRPRRESYQQHAREQREVESEPLPAHHHLSYNRAHWHHHQKPGGPCDHCGAVESPQWRRGPSHKPVLCNACGTRFRRTHQLGVPSSPGNGKARGGGSAGIGMFKRGKGKEQPVMVSCHS